MQTNKQTRATGIRTHITAKQYAHVARAYHHQLRVKLHDPVWRSFWWEMFGWAQRCRVEYQESLVKGQRSLW
jgi:hypothetical protein